MESENSSNLQSRVLSFFQANLLISALFFLGMIFLVVGLIQFMGRSNSDSITFEKGEDVKAAQTSSTSKIIVDVSGEVEKPGVYRLDSDSRVQDAIDKAGGVTSTANKEYISKALNLAQKLSDGMKIYIPRIGEEGNLNMTNMSNTTYSIGSQSGLISINSGSQGELESLPGIGPVTAQKIMDLRPYGSISELLDKKAVGQAVFEKIKDLISL